jgi:HSP20 family molecular chaperone IbpA
MSELANRPTSPDVIATVFADEWPSLDRLFEGLAQRSFSPWTAGAWGRLTPLVAPVDVVDLGQSYEIRADLPGFAKDKIDLRVQGNVVTLRAEQPDTVETKDEPTYLRRERGYRSVERAFELPELVVADQVAAKYLDGVLTLSIPKAHPVTEQKIPVT